MKRSDVQPFMTRMRVGLDDVDYVQVLYFPRVAHLCCTALEEFFRVELGLPWTTMINEHNLSMPTVDLHVVYRRPLRFGDELDIAIRVAEIGNRKATYEYTMTESATGQVTSITTHTVVFVQQNTWEAIPIPDAYRSALERHRQ